ncbi:quinone oxidoreductase [Aquimarina sp. D1M17]|uniref:quinone oxidoreductase family protein n=1 Tax=Aquimarina acroporae TaxID=2937283 RepID=UPI0020C14217|nr:quinone oxidoreductase [Aquimarina acroporae]MCK8520101.1 quinone oxidoreductase [Aquimarina acroporae]
MPQAIVIREYGDHNVLRLEEVDTRTPHAHELVIKQTAIGVNFHDIYVRSGLYNTLSLPGTPGIEGIGTVIQIGKNVKDFSIGDKVGYITSTYGGYASEQVISADLVVSIPEEIDDIAAAAALLKGLTVEMLINKVAQLKPNNWVLIHAASGGVGRLLVQAAKNRGALVIGTVGSTEKAEIAKANGCDYIILYQEEDVVEKVMEFTQGRGVKIVYDSVGKSTFHGSLASLDIAGHLVNFGQSSGPIEGFEIPMLAKKSSTLSRPMLFHYTNNREELLNMSSSFFDKVIRGKITLAAPLTFPLSEAAKAHELMASRKLMQPVVLIP